MSLVSVGVRLHAATTSSRGLSLHLIHRPTGERVRYQPFVPEVGPVPKEEIVKGYEYERGQHVTIEDDELDRLKLESKHTIALVRFVDSGAIDPIYFDRPYFVAPDTELSEEPFIVLRDALRATGKTALGQVTLSGKEHIAAIRPCGRGLILETLRYADEVRRAHAFFDEIPDLRADDEQIDLARALIDKKTGSFDPSEFEDRQQQMLKELIESKIKRRPLPAKGEKRTTAKVVNLMDALRRSVEEAEAETGGAPARRSARPRAGGSGGEKSSAGAAGRKRRKSA
jgi:DNA end-binding protein Ku